MGETKHQSKAPQTRGHLRLHYGAKDTPRPAWLTLRPRVSVAAPTPPDYYLQRAQELLDQQSPEAASSPPHLMTLAEFAWYCQVSVRTVKRWIREAKLTDEKGLRTLPGDIKRVDLSVWERWIHYFTWPAVIGMRALAPHSALAAILHTLYYSTLHAHMI